VGEMSITDSEVSEGNFLLICELVRERTANGNSFK